MSLEKQRATRCLCVLIPGMQRTAECSEAAWRVNMPLQIGHLGDQVRWPPWEGSARDRKEPKLARRT